MKWVKGLVFHSGKPEKRTQYSFKIKINYSINSKMYSVKKVGKSLNN